MTNDHSENTRLNHIPKKLIEFLEQRGISNFLINFLLELGDTNLGASARYEVANMSGVDVAIIDRLISDGGITTY